MNAQRITTAQADIDSVRAIADSVGCLIEEDFQALADITPSTAEGWRKRGKGPSYILLGNRYLYPRDSVAAFLKTQVRQCGGKVSAKELL